MKLEFDLSADRKAAEDLLILPGEGTLSEHAEFMRRHLDCTAVVVTIAGRFLRVLQGNAAGPPSAPQSRVCVMAVDADGPEARRKVVANPGKLADPMAAGEMGFGFYAGLPLRLSSGGNVGVLAAVDFSPRSLAKNELATLKMLANIVVQIIEFRLATSGPSAGETAGF